MTFWGHWLIKMDIGPNVFNIYTAPRKLKVCLPDQWSGSKTVRNKNPGKNPLCRAVPLKKHTFYLFEIFRTGLGGGGSEEDVICVLPLNMINQKFFSIFYLWLAFLFVLTLVSLTIKLCLIFSKESREMVLLFVYRIKSVNVSSYLKNWDLQNCADVFACFFSFRKLSWKRFHMEIGTCLFTS